jgi:hypothetical protein
MEDIDMEVLKKLNGDKAIKEYIDSLGIEDIRSFNSANNVKGYDGGGAKSTMFIIIDKDIQQNKGMFDEFFK